MPGPCSVVVWFSGKRSALRTWAERNRPGDTGARSKRPPSWWPQKSTRTPKSSAALAGQSRPPNGDMPTASGSARVSTRVFINSGSKGPRLPILSPCKKIASTRAISFSPFSNVAVMIFARWLVSSFDNWPLATSPAAMPAIVGSIHRGNTLLVPVDRGIITTSCQI